MRGLAVGRSRQRRQPAADSGRPGLVPESGRIVRLGRAVTRRCGPKAGTLGRLFRLGFPVPDGFVILPEARAPAGVRAPRKHAQAGAHHGPGGEAEPALAREIQAEIARIGARSLAVRSSAMVEDRGGRSAAGLFVSLLNVAPTARAVLEAAARCRASLEASHVRAYLRNRGCRVGELDRGPHVRSEQRLRGSGMAVLVQPMVEGPKGVLFTRDPDEPASMRLEIVRSSGRVEHAAVARHEAGRPGPWRDLCLLGLRAERALGVPLDIEFALAPSGPVLLQARPAPRPRARPARLSIPPELRAATFVLDAEHNPEPLSPVHADLVRRLDAGGRAGGRLAVIRGYLYAEERRGGGTGDGAGGMAAGAGTGQKGLRELWRGFVRRWTRELAAAEKRSPMSVSRALVFFERFYAEYAGLLQPALARERRALLGMMSARDLAAIAATARSATTRRDEALFRLARLPASRRRQALGRLLARYGALPAAWDVSVPTYAEDPSPLLAVLEGLGRSRCGPEERRRARRLPVGIPARLAARARLVASIAEEDDLFFARALRVLRRALLARGDRLVRHGAIEKPGDVFMLPLFPEPAPDPALRLRVARAKSLLERQRRFDPPVRIVEGRPEWDLPKGGLRGHGCGGRARGRVFRHVAPGVPAGAPGGAVLVCATLLPSWTFVLPRLAAVVAERGGALSHGAILAREYGVPAVFGVRGALTTLRDGEPVVVDGAAGRVWRERTPGSR